MGFSNVSLAIIFFIPFLAMASPLSKPQIDITSKHTTTVQECHSRSFNATEIRDCLNAHNKARAQIGVGLGALKWNHTVAAYAQNYAAKRAHDCELIHSEGPYGENLSQGSYEFSPIEAVKWWFDDEKEFYDYSSNECNGGACKHYTQIVWATTVSVGCAKVKCSGDKGFFMICSYCPPGNIVGLKPY